MPITQDITTNPMSLDDIMRHAHRSGRNVLLTPVAGDEGRTWSAQLVPRGRLSTVLASMAMEAQQVSESKDKPPTGLRRPFGHLSERSPRAAEWKVVFGETSVPITSPIPVRAEIGGIGVREVYLIELSRLEPEQFDRLVAHVAAKNNMPQEEIRAHLVNEGVMPALAEDIDVSMDMRFLL